MPYCSNCGAEVGRKANFCPMCGFNLSIPDSQINVGNDSASCPSCGNSDKLRWSTMNNQWACDNCGHYFTAVGGAIPQKEVSIGRSNKHDIPGVEVHNEHGEVICKIEQRLAGRAMFGGYRHETVSGWKHPKAIEKWAWETAQNIADLQGERIDSTATSTWNLLSSYIERDDIESDSPFTIETSMLLDRFLCSACKNRNVGPVYRGWRRSHQKLVGYICKARDCPMSGVIIPNIVIERIDEIPTSIKRERKGISLHDGIAFISREIADEPSMHILPLDYNSKSLVALFNPDTESYSLPAITTPGGHITLFPVGDEEGLHRVQQFVWNKMENLPEGYKATFCVAVLMSMEDNPEKILLIIQVGGDLESVPEFEHMYKCLSSLRVTKDKYWTDVERFYSIEPAKSWLNSLIEHSKEEINWSEYVSEAMQFGSSSIILTDTTFSRAREYRRRALDHKIRGELDDAIADYIKTIQSDKDWVLAHYELGQIYKRLGKKVDAIAHFKQVISMSKNPDTVEAAKRNMEELRSGFPMGEDERLDIDSPEVLMKWAASFYDEERYDDALANYNQAIRLKPDDTEILFYRGTIFLQKGRYREALDDLNQVIKLKPTDPLCLLNRGVIYTHMGRYDESIADFNKVLEIEPNDEAVHYNLAVAYTITKKSDSAIQHLDKAINLDEAYRLYAVENITFDSIRDDPRFKKLMDEG